MKNLSNLGLLPLLLLRLKNQQGQSNLQLTKPALANETTSKLHLPSEWFIRYAGEQLPATESRTPQYPSAIQAFSHTRSHYNFIPGRKQNTH